LYVTDRDKIRTISVATGEVRTLATLPGSFSLISGDGDNLYVTGRGGTWRFRGPPVNLNRSSMAAMDLEEDSSSTECGRIDRLWRILVRFR
jgi:hypothetical protein